MPDLPNITSSDSPALFLDFDGTLVDIFARPDLTSVSPQLISMLDHIYQRLGGAMAIVTGRPLADLDRLLAPLRLPAAGIHGIQHRDGTGRVESRCQTAIPDDVRVQIKALATSDSRLILEDKGHSLGLHYRQAPELETVLRSKLADISGTLGPKFSVQDGKMVLELRPVGIDKGSAIEKFMSEAPFSGRHVVFIGDDITDEDAFAVVNRMHGYSAKVGPPGPATHTAAQFSLNDVADVHAWLKTLAQH
jgi:trehalose 6-phosphate phosphatase